MSDQGKVKGHGEGGETGDSLRRVQSYDLKDLVREKELGNKYALRELVQPLERVQGLFRLIPPSHIAYFPEQQQNTIRDQANAFYNFLEQCASFEIEGAQPTPTDAKQALILKAEGLYQSHFNVLFPFISFATARSQDFARLEQEARAATQAIKDESTALIDQFEKQKESGQRILEEVRAVAAEQGVGNQAIHFKAQADDHRDQAKNWMKYTLLSIALVTVYSVVSLFIHNIPGLDTDNPYHTIHLAVSKILIFGILAYLTLLSAKNYLSHRHNEIVNRHRQNALSTFTALAEATSDAASSDIVLSHAAACIFSPQETGLTRQDSTGSEGVPSLQIIPRIGSLSGGSAS